MFSPWLLGKLPHGCDREAEDRSPSPVGRGPGCTGIELSELRQDRSADFSPLPAVWAGPERGGLKSALLNSMAVHPHPDPLPALYVAVLLYQRGERERERGNAIFNEVRAGA